MIILSQDDLSCDPADLALAQVLPTPAVPAASFETRVSLGYQLSFCVVNSQPDRANNESVWHCIT